MIIALTFAGFASAQIRTDGSFGPAHTFTGSPVTIGAEFGTLKGTNLFHSFSAFNVGQNEKATFTGPSSVANIIGRVTGGSASSVNGAIESQIPKANLILVNPAGWVFGPKASLNVSGSVHISTADAVRFADGTTMPTRTPESSSLTVAPPTAFGFLGPNAGTIHVTGVSLSAAAGKDLSLVGGPVQIENASLSASAAKVRIVSAASAGDVSVQGGVRPANPPARYGDVTLSNAAISVSNASGGTAPGGVRIRGGIVTIREKSSIVTGNLDDARYPTVAVRGDDVAVNGSQLGTGAVGSGVGGSIKVKASRSVTLGPDGSGNTSILAGASANAATTGSITVAAGRNITVQPGTKVGAGTFNAHPPAPINLQAQDITIAGPDTGVLSGASADSPARAGPVFISANNLIVMDGAIVGSAGLGSGDSGTITISTSRLTIQNLGQINTSTVGSGNAGSININGTALGSRIAIIGNNESGRTGIFSDAYGATNSGHISVNADAISLQGGQISSTNFGSGAAGSVDVTARQLLIDGANRSAGAGGIFSNVEPAVFSPGVITGSAGPITVKADTISLHNRGEITSSTFGNGNGGPVTVIAGNLSLDSRSGLFSSAGQPGDDRPTGNGGEINVVADRITLTQGGLISSSSLDAGKGGNIVISGHTQPLELQVSGAGSSIQAKASSSQTNGAGSINILGRNLAVLDGGEINTAAQAGGGGQISLGAVQLVRLDQGSITTSVSGGNGNAGDITMGSRSIVLNHGRIFAEADAGSGGHIGITAQTYIASPDSVLDASAPHGINGIITIQAPQSNVAGTLAELPANLLAPPALQQRGCSAAAASQGVSSFVLGSAGGLPRTGDGPQSAPYIDLPQTPAHFAAQPDKTPILAAPLNPAQACWR